MQLLDLIADALARENLRKLQEPHDQKMPPGALGLVSALTPSVDVQVFSVLDCHAQEDFEKFIPGIGNVFQTPVVGFWDGDTLREPDWCGGARTGRKTV